MKRSIVIYIFVLAAGGLAAYAGSLGDGFCYDENIVILGNDHVQKDGQLRSILSGTYWGSAAAEQKVESLGYRPLTILTYYVTRKAAGNDPFWFHFFNVVLHVLCCVLLLLFLLKLGLPELLAFLASALFAVHAVHTEAVTQIVGRAELLAAFFVLLALLLHAAARGDRAGKTAMLAAGAAASCFAGMLAKEDAAGFIPAALCADLLLLGREKNLRETLLELFRGGRWRIYLIYLIPVILFLLLRTLLLGRPLPTFDVHFVDNPLSVMPPLLRPLGALAVFGKVLGLMLLPLNLSADYGFNQIPVDRFYASGAFYLGLFSLAAVTALCFLRRRAWPFIFLGWIMFIVTFLPVSNIFFLIHTILGERVLYIPSIGFCIFLASILYALAKSRRGYVGVAAFSAMGALLLFHGVRTHVRNADWKDDLTLFESTARVSGNSVRALNNYGNVLLLRGDLEGAESSYRKALRLFPGYDDAAVNLSGVLIRKGKPEEAAAILKEVLRRKPDHKTAKANLALALKLTQRAFP